uniref:BACK domain-containing protein n=1 Tax=Timema tahoe TaxID=61484 RepID=A0A7R9FML8_9NEOP|nr:unnamed protein product [Timema tahoe]
MGLGGSPGNVGERTSSEEEKEEFCCEAVIELAVDDCINKLSSTIMDEYSSARLINGFYWQLNVAKDYEESLGAYLFCLSKDKGSLPNCYAEYNIRLLNRMDSGKSITVREERWFSDSKAKRSMISDLDTILKISNGFIKDDTMLFEVRVAFGSCRQKQDAFLTKKEAILKELLLIEAANDPIATRSEQLSFEPNDICELLAGRKCFKMISTVSKILPAQKNLVFEQVFFNSNKEEVAADVFHAIRKYKLPKLTYAFLEHIWPTDYMGDVIFPLNFAMKLNLNYLGEEVMKIIRKNLKEVLKRPDFVDLSQDSLLAIVEQQALNLDSEFELFNAVVLWSRAQCEKQGLEVNGHNIRAVLGDVLKHIRFLAMTPEEVTGPVCDIDVLTTEQQNLVLRRYFSKGTMKTLLNVCCLKKPRERIFNFDD